MLFYYYFVTCCFLFGLAVGSFLNVVIYRVPRELSIVSPPSSCPNCNRAIKPWENIPLLSYFLLLRGKCAGCGLKISLQYPCVELFTGVVFAAVAWRFGLTFETFVYIAYSGALIALSVIDLQTRLLPDTIVLPGLIISCLLALATFHPYVHSLWPVTALDSFLGMAAGGLPLVLLSWGYFRLTGREGMGGGDVKLMFFTGALLGPGKAFLTLFIGSFTGAIIGSMFLHFASRGRHTQIPFGPFLATGAWIALMWGQEIISGYLAYADLPL